MQTIEVNDRTWDNLLAIAQGDRNGLPDLTDGGAIYAPIAGAFGSFVIAQVGQSLDGRVATLSGDARDVSGSDGLIHLHRCRALVDAVIVGVNTVTVDDPRLSVRMVKGRDPVRVIVDCHGQLDGAESLFHDNGAPVIVVQSTKAPRKAIANATIIRLPAEDCGLNTGAILQALAEKGLHRILVEGGARTIARFIEAGHVDRLHVAISPIIIGSGPSGINLSPIQRLCEAYRPATTVYSLGSDVLFDCIFRRKPLLERQGDEIGVADLA
jgi:diaminohydroxyphosphoribosylaminopyrimidine deaminase / 5-amino-6-(5-phosphoribosylamino)uracil reductase